MNKTQKARTTTSTLTDSQFETFCETVAKGMDKNTDFPSPVPPIPDLVLQIADYSTALIDAESRDRKKVARKKQLRKGLALSVTSLGNYVNAVCQGNLTMLAGSGFPITKKPEPKHISVPANIAVEQGPNAGMLISKVKAVKEAKSYLHQVTPDPLTKESEWTTVTTTKSKNTFTGLEEGKKYWFKVIAIGSNGQSASSAEASQYVMQRNPS